MALDDDVLAFFKSFLNSPETAKAVLANPQAAMQEYRVADMTTPQANHALSQLVTTPGVSPGAQGALAGLMSSGAAAPSQGAVADVFRSFPPAMQAPMQTLASIVVPTAVENTTINNINESTRITDNHQQLYNYGGSVTEQNASGDGAVVVGAGAEGTTVGTGSGHVIGAGATADGSVLSNAPMIGSTVIAGGNTGQISGQDHIQGSGNATDSSLTASPMNSPGATASAATHGGINAAGGSATVDSPGGATASGSAQAATGGGAPGAEGGSVGGTGNLAQVGDGNLAQVGGDNVAQSGEANVNAPNSVGVQASGPGGENTQLAQNQQAYGAGSGDGGQPAVQLQSGEVNTGGGEGQIFADASAPPDPGLGAPDPGISHEPMDPGISDQPAGTENTDPLA